MLNRASTSLLVCLATVLAQRSARVSAQGTPIEPAVEAETVPEAAPAAQVEVRSRRRIAATHGEDPSASGTAISLTDRVTIPRSLGDVVREMPGAQVASTGGMGAFSSLSLRGGGGEETQVLLDEIPLSTADGGAFDLSLFPAELFAQVNTFRGGAPVWLGSGAVGGVLQLVPRRGERNRMSATLGAGSFGTYQLQGGSEVATPRGIHAHTQLLVRGTQGDYPYRDDGGTRYTSADDRSYRLRNGDFQEAVGLSDLSVPAGRGTLRLLSLGLVRGGGFPGPASQPTPRIRREATRALLAGTYDREAGAPGAFARKLQLLASGAFGADRFSDHYGQLGTSGRSNSENRNFRLFVRAAGTLELTRWLHATSVSSYAYDRYLPFDAYLRRAPPSSERHTAASALELSLHGELGRVRFELRPSARFEWSHTELRAAPSLQELAPRTRNVLAPTARLGAVVEPVGGLAISGSVATGTRLPALFELFGDGGLVLPSLSLEPVSATTYDAGVSLRGRLGSLSLQAELRGFLQERRDSIALVRTSQFQVAHENIASVQQCGVETHLSGAVARILQLAGSFTWLDTETAVGKRLPLRPRYVAYARPELRIPVRHALVSSVSVSTELTYRSHAYVDVANLAYTDRCTKLAAGGALSLFRERVRVSARLDDTLDARCTDLVGYPLPGRSLFFSVSYREVEHEPS